VDTDQHNNDNENNASVNHRLYYVS